MRTVGLTALRVYLILAVMLLVFKRPELAPVRSPAGDAA